MRPAIREHRTGWLPGALAAVLSLAWPAAATTAGSAQIEVLYQAAAAAQSKLEWARTLELTEQIDKLDPDYKLTGFYAAFSLQRLGRDSLAVIRYRSFLATHGDFTQGHFNLAYALMQLKLYREATAEFQRTLELNPDYYEVHLHLGNCLQQLGDEKSAQLHLQIWNRR